MLIDKKKWVWRTILICVLQIVLMGVCQGESKPHHLKPKNKVLSFYFQKIQVRALLELIAKNSGLNFIISDSVTGDITLNLKNVTWQEALATILETQGLASRRLRNVIYIGTVDNVTSNEAKQLKSKEMLANLSPLKTVLVSLKYTSADTLAGVLKGEKGTLLSGRGQVLSDNRTNSLIIKDTADNIKNILPQIKQLDIPARQVVIEARIVNIDINWESQLGVRFGLSNTRHLSGTLAGASSIANGTNANAVDPYTNRLNFNIPAAALLDGSTPASAALALARLGPVLLDLELSALEGENHAKVISQPRLITSNQQKAIIQTGEEIPYQEATSSGATSISFKKAVLSLEIIPQVTPDNKIILKLKATEDTRGQNVAVGSSATAGSPGATSTVNIPAINTRQVESTVLLNNNETIVVGGVYKTNKLSRYDRVPFFGSLPMVGNLFGYKSSYYSKGELLIFITPRILGDNGQPLVFNNKKNNTIN